MPHVVRLLDAGIVESDAHGGSGTRTAMLLSPYGRHLDSGDSTGLLARVALHVAKAIAGCGRLMVAHRDVTPFNIIVHGGQGYLADFSVGKVRGSQRRTRTQRDKCSWSTPMLTCTLLAKPDHEHANQE